VGKGDGKCGVSTCESIEVAVVCVFVEYAK